LNETKIYTFAFALTQDIKIKALGLKGTVTGMSININGYEYQVVYWNNGERFSHWMHPWEIE
jgi:hypothetical protein